MNSGSGPKRRKTLLRRTFRWAFLPLLGIYVLFSIWFYLFQETVLFRPNAEPTGYVPEPSLKPSMDVLLEPPEATINVQKFDATDPPKGIVFYLHGNRGNIHLCLWEIKPFVDAGYDVWTMDYRGFGKSTGRLSEAALLADAQIVYKRIREESDEEDIIVWGRSFGTGVAAYVASVNSPKTLVLETPYCSLPDAVCHSHPYVLPFLFRYRLPTHEYLNDVHCTVHLIHGTKDEKIDFHSSKRLEKRCLELEMEVQFHPIQNGYHNLRPESDFETVLKQILE
jgi:alpha-beta hydrolase superfamily lysophospholipase